LTPQGDKSIDWGKIFFLLADRFGYTIDQVCEMTLDSALILLSEGKDPTRRVVSISPGEDVSQALRKLRT